VNVGFRTRGVLAGAAREPAELLPDDAVDYGGRVSREWRVCADTLRFIGDPD
jgi:hypothetical protein